MHTHKGTDSFDEQKEKWQFSRDVLSHIHGEDFSTLRMFTIEGDSMEPILSHGDNLLINCADTMPSPPGIFVLFDGFGISVKQLEIACQLGLHQVRISSANKQYSAYHRKLSDMMIKGRVIWYGRSIG